MAGLQKARHWFYYNQKKRKSKDFRKKNAFLKYIKCIFENRRQGRRGGSSGEQGCQGRFVNKKRKATVPSVKEKGDACEEAPLRMHELFCLRQKSRGWHLGAAPTRQRRRSCTLRRDFVPFETHFGVPWCIHELFCLRQKSRGRVSGRCPDPAEAPPLHSAKGLRPFRNPFWGSLRMHELFCLRQKSRGRVSGRCLDPAEAPPLHPAKGLRPFRNPSWGG